MKQVKLFISAVVGVTLLLVLIGAPVLSAGKEEVTINAWTMFSPGHDLARYMAFSKVLTLWELKNPNIKIKHTHFRAQPDFETIVPLAVKAEVAGDLITADPAGLAVWPWFEEGKTVALDKWALQYGWIDRFQPGTFEILGAGVEPSSIYDGPSIVALPIFQQPLGIFYNKEIFKQLGVEPPGASWEAFVDLIEKVKNTGYTPFVFANQAQWHAMHLLSSTLAANVHIDRLTAWFSGDPNVRFTDPDFLWSIQICVDWANRGYFTKDFNAIDFDDALGFFLKGDQPMILTGDWNVPRFVQTAEFEIGFFPIPPHNKNIPWAIVNYPIWPFVMTSWCTHKEEAARFLDFLASEETARAFYEQGHQPVLKFDPKGVPGFDLQREVFQGMQGKRGSYYVDTADRQVMVALRANMQKCLGNLITPEECATLIQKARDEFLAGR